MYPGTRERRVTVASNDSGPTPAPTCARGQEIIFTSSGQVRWGPSRRDGVGGERNSPENRNRPIPSGPGAALIGKVGDREEFFFIGEDSGPSARGRLAALLGINDDV